jgi:hypothetical protein
MNTTPSPPSLSCVFSPSYFLPWNDGEEMMYQRKLCDLELSTLQDHEPNGLPLLVFYPVCGFCYSRKKKKQQQQKQTKIVLLMISPLLHLLQV